MNDTDPADSRGELAFAGPDPYAPTVDSIVAGQSKDTLTMYDEAHASRSRPNVGPVLIGLLGAERSATGGTLPAPMVRRTESER